MADDEIIARRSRAQRRTAIEIRSAETGIPVSAMLVEAIEKTATMKEAADVLEISVATLTRYREKFGIKVVYTR